MVPPEVWKSEVCSGLDPKLVAQVLAERDMLLRVEDGYQKVHKISGLRFRCAVIRHEPHSFRLRCGKRRNGRNRCNLKAFLNMLLKPKSLPKSIRLRRLRPLRLKSPEVAPLKSRTTAWKSQMAVLRSKQNFGRERCALMTTWPSSKAAPSSELIMPRRPATITQADVARAIRAVKQSSFA